MADLSRRAPPQRSRLVRQRQAIIVASAELQERELIKLASLASALAEALRGRGVEDPTASLTAEAGIAVFRVAFERYVGATELRDLPLLIRESLDELSAVIAGRLLVTDRRRLHSEAVSPAGEEDSSFQPRRAVPTDLDRVTATLWSAFDEDPLWTWAFPGARKLDVWWRFLAGSALRHREIWVAGDFEAVSVWIPPGEKELTATDEARVEPLLQGLLGTRTKQVMELLERFEESHPKDVSPHYYLSLLGTHADHRGRGVGMRLLAENLALIDEQRMPAYLESSNPANEARYERVGFERIGKFETPDGSRTVAMMWRDPT
jgi:GNAT superfamily N-acetyltransferase